MAMPQEDETELITVQHSRHMDAETFRKHMAARHLANLAGRFSIGPFHDPYVEQCWRAYHNSVHKFALHDGLDHDHGD